jgi:hypothetical protein
MYDTSLEPGQSLEAVYHVWVVFKAKIPASLASDLERVIGEALNLMPIVQRVTVEHSKDAKMPEIGVDPK